MRKYSQREGFTNFRFQEPEGNFHVRFAVQNTQLARIIAQIIRISQINSHLMGVLILLDLLDTN